MTGAVLEVVRVPVLTDNYAWLLHEPVSGETAVIDPGEAEPVLAAANARGWRIGQVWNTHWHPDHVGGNAAVKAATGAVIVGPAAEAAKIGMLDRTVAPGDRIALGGLEADVIDLAAHTAGHVAFHFASAEAAFVGDTLFAMGCGRLFEGTAADMHAALARLATLPDATAVYCGHEYTQSNARYALHVEPDNAAIVARAAEVDRLRAAGEATIPTSIGLERATNPFLRAASAEELGRLRAGKDSFKG